ncbi:hypothetical protein MASR2M8_03090 [Opitutaceae bacterium]
MPRTDLAAFFQLGPRPALAEFTVDVVLQPGAAEVIYEVLEIGGTWREFARAVYFVSSHSPPVDYAVPSGPLRWHEFGRLVRHVLRTHAACAEESLQQQAAREVARLPWPRDLRHPPLPFHGHLDEPAALVRNRFGQAPVLGYLFHETQPLRAVHATFDLQALQPVEHDRPSPTVTEYYPQFPLARTCGLFGMVDLPAQLPDPVPLRLYAELDDGSLHLCTVQRSRVLTAEDEKRPYPSCGDNVLARALEAIHEAMATRGITVTDETACAAELERISEEMGTLRPRRKGSTGPEVSHTTQLTRSPPSKRRVVVASHNLNHEGAPLFLLDYVQSLVTAGLEVAVLSPAGGPLKSRFEAVGAQVRIIAIADILAANSEAAVRAGIARLGREEAFAACELVVANTFTTFWAIHAANAAGCPSVLYVHESTTPAAFYHEQADRAVIAAAEEAFGLADAVSFTTPSTLDYHRNRVPAERRRLIPGWIDVERIDQWKRGNPRGALRARLGVGPDELLVTNIGTVCERKGQHIFSRAVDLLARRQPALASRTRFLMLGGGNSLFDQSLTALLRELHRPQLVVHPSSADYFPYYAAADLFVCSTYEESSPRVILEAMAFGTPILSSEVHGIGEQVRNGREAMLVPPGNTHALAEGLATLLQASGLRQTLAAAARQKVRSEFDRSAILPRHVALACELAGLATGPHVSRSADQPA